MVKEKMKYVIAGGPCTGKSTLIRLLKDQGYQTVPEAGRMLLKENTYSNSSQNGIYKSIFLGTITILQKRHT